jgi:hypothetical protein
VWSIIYWNTRKLEVKLHIHKDIWTMLEWRWTHTLPTLFFIPFQDLWVIFHMGYLNSHFLQSIWIS